MPVLSVIWLVIGCNPVPAAWQRPVGALGILVGVLSIVFSAQLAAASGGRTSRPVAVLVGAAFVVIGGLALLGVIHFAEHC